MSNCCVCLRETKRRCTEASHLSANVHHLCSTECHRIHAISTAVDKPSILRPSLMSFPDIIITSPHSMCDQQPLCDKGSESLANSFAGALNKTETNILVLPATTPRAICDLNRRKCRYRPYLRNYLHRLAQLSRRQASTNATAVLDAHSFPATYDWGLKSVPNIGIVLRPANRRRDHGFCEVDAALITRMLAWAGEGWTVHPEHFASDRSGPITIRRGNQIFFAIVQGSDENYIITKAEQHNILGVLTEINDDTSVNARLTNFFAQTIVAAVFDALHSIVGHYPSGIHDIVYSPVSGHVRSSTVDPATNQHMIEISLSREDSHLVYAAVSGTVNAMTLDRRSIIKGDLVRTQVVAGPFMTVEMKTENGHLVTFRIDVTGTQSADEAAILTAKQGAIVSPAERIGKVSSAIRAVVIFESNATVAVEIGEEVIPNSVLGYWASI